MRKQVLWILCALLPLGMYAQNDDEQVLVFRHSGEVNLFYSAQLDSIVLSEYDADSVKHDEVVSQVFYAQDTTMVVPIDEIDSVAFGNRNVIEIRADVKEMTAETDLPWIIRFDSTAIHYRLNTPENILPKTGQKLFYGLDGNDSEDAIFPYGLTALVTAVTRLADEIQVDVEMVELSEIFSKLFYAGRIHKENVTQIKQRRSPLHWGEERNWVIPIGEQGRIDIKAKITLDGDAVLNPLRSDYQYADLDVNFSIGVDLKASMEDDSNAHIETFNGHYVPIGTFYRILNFGAALGAFLDASGEMSIAFSVERNYYRRVQWTNRGGESVWNFPDVPEQEHVQDKAGFEVVLDGTLFFGPILALDIATVGHVIGARFKAKIGPEYEAKVSGSLLSSLREYQPELYGSVELSMRNKLAIETYLTHRRPWRKDVIETKIADWSIYAPEHKIDLLPHFTETRGVHAVTKTNTEVSVATHVDNEIIHEVETGFEIVDAEDNIVDSIYVDVIKAYEPEVQGVDAVFELPKQTESVLDSLRARPVFHYAGYTIRGDFVPIMHDSHLQPIIFYGTNGVTTYIAGASVVDTAKEDSTVYHIGNYLPIPIIDPVFGGWWVDKPSGNYFDPQGEYDIEGTWMGNFDDDVVVIVLKEDGTGSYTLNGNEVLIDYKLNDPQSGDLQLYHDNKIILSLTIVSINDTTLIVKKKGHKKQYSLNKQY